MTSEEKGYKLAKMTIKIKKGKSGKYYCPSIKLKQLRQLQKFISRKYWHVNNEDLLYLEGQKKHPDKTQYNQLMGYPEYLIEELMEAKTRIK